MKTKKLKYHKRVSGFTITEILIVLAIIGFLVAIAMPKQTSVVAKAKATEAKLQLKQVHSLQKTYFFEHSKYASSLSDIGFEQVQLSTEGGSANYRIEITSASANSFTARAIAVVDFDQDGQMNVWEVNQNNQIKEITQD